MVSSLSKMQCRKCCLTCSNLFFFYYVLEINLRFKNIFGCIVLGMTKKNLKRVSWTYKWHQNCHLGTVTQQIIPLFEGNCLPCGWHVYKINSKHLVSACFCLVLFFPLSRPGSKERLHIIGMAWGYLRKKKKMWPKEELVPKNCHCTNKQHLFLTWL